MSINNSNYDPTWWNNAEMISKLINPIKEKLFNLSNEKSISQDDKFWEIIGEINSLPPTVAELLKD